MKIVFAGQSNAARIETNLLAIAELTSVFDEPNNPCEVSFSAVGGSALLKSNASTSHPDNFWIGKSSLGKFYKSDLMNDAIAHIESVKPDIVIWIQGEQDATRVTDKNGKDDHKNALKYLFDQLLGHCDLVVVVSIGRRLSNKDKGFHLIRMATIDAANEVRNVEVMAHNYPLELEDVVHYSAQAQIDLCRDLAVNITNYLNGTPIAIGAKAIEAKGYSRDVDVTFDSSIGSSIGSNSYKLFSIRDINGNLLQSPAWITRLSSIKVRLTFTTLPIKQYICIGVGQLVGIESNSSMHIVSADGKHIQPAMVKIF